MIAFDIETGPLPWRELQPLLPAFDEAAAVPDPGKFDAGSVPVGNLKDPAKIEAKIAKAEADHEQLLASVASRRAAARNAYHAAAKEKAALSPLTGRVLAVGFFDGSDKLILHGEPGDIDDELTGRSVRGHNGEAALLEVCWRFLTGKIRVAGETAVGHNIERFDLPFLVVRSRALGVDVPREVLKINGRWPNWNPSFADTIHHWTFGGALGGSKEAGQSMSLDSICRALGGPTKHGDKSGAAFAADYEAGGNRRTEAFEYLFTDLDMTWFAAERAGLL